MKKIKEINVWLPLPELHGDVIAEYIKKAEKSGYNKITFLFGIVTQVSFSILL